MTWYSLISLVRNVSQEESESRLDAAEHAAPSQSTSDDSRCIRPSRSKSYDVDSPSAAASLGVELKYLPGRAQASRIETMMSKQELEEEQRVQREQLAAIFQLLRENKQTFGEVSEGELEDQFRLYST
uniref:Matrix-remodeling-associated protein 7 helical domain-containing protein n=1 Tax=Gadus morhua TaxID=8049 RepID=A0A8C5AXC1_GADMO